MYHQKLDSQNVNLTQYLVLFICLPDCTSELREGVRKEGVNNEYFGGIVIEEVWGSP